MKYLYGAVDSDMRQVKDILYLALTPGVVIHLYREPVDMRRLINGLVTIFEGQMELDPFSAVLFRCHTPIKLVYWEGNGFALLMKRLDRSRFQWPRTLPVDVIERNAQQVSWLLDGYDPTVMQDHPLLAHHTVL